MGQHTNQSTFLVGNWIPQRMVEWARRLGTRTLLLLAICLTGILLAGPACLAQDTSKQHIRAHELATGTRTAGAGEHLLDSIAGTVYVPKQCVGTLRCPLVIAAFHQDSPKRWHRQLADKYGMIFAEVGRYKGKAGMDAIDSTVKWVLPNFAIDADRIALVTENLDWWFTAGRNVGDIFSRVAALWWPDYTVKPISPQDTTTQFRVISGLNEYNGPPVFKTVFGNAQILRRTGFTVAYVGVLRGHDNCVDDYEDMWQWFVDSWATPNPARRTRPHTTVKTMPLLDDAFSRMINSEVIGHRPWGHARPYRKELAIPVGEEQQLIMIPDIPAQAEHDTETVAKLKMAGITAQQAEGYLAAFLTAVSVGPLDSLGVVKVEPNSIVRKNIDFLKAHPDNRAALEPRLIECHDSGG